ATDNAGSTGSNAARFTILPLSVPERPSPVIDGWCADEAYQDALEVRLPFGPQAFARISHGDGALAVAFTGLPFAADSNAPVAIGLVVDIDASRSSGPQTNDVGFYVDEGGVPSQWLGDGSALIINLQPDTAVRTAITRGDFAWSAELSIPDRLLGG